MVDKVPEAAEAHAINENRQGFIGRGLDRIDGPLKVSGRAIYSYEYKHAGQALYGFIGAGAAVANAVFNATGIRVREFPVTLDKLLPNLPQPI